MLYAIKDGLVASFWNPLFGVKEKSLPMTTSHDALRGHIRNALMKAYGLTDTWSSASPWIVDVFKSYVVYSMAGETWKRKYKVETGVAGADPTVTFDGEPTKVHVAYVDSKDPKLESFRLLFDATGVGDENRDLFESLYKEEGSEKRNDYALKDAKRVREGATLEIDMVEAKKSSSGLSKIPIKIISPGWGSSAYYSKLVLQEAATNKIFGKGTHMYFNHASATEEADRPEGDINNLAAVLTTDAEWKDTGPKGAGLYAEAKVFSDYAQQVEEKGAHIGVSINAGIKAHEGEVEGKTGLIADKFVYGYSTDFVTRAGAGGAPIVPALESDRRNPIQKEADMTEAEIKALQDENKRLKDLTDAREAEDRRSKVRTLAVAAVTEALKGAEVTLSTKAVERLCESPKTLTMSDGTQTVDPKWVEAVVKDMTEGMEAGRVTGMGGPTHKRKEAETLTAEEEKAFRETMKGLGVPDTGLDSAVKGVK